MPNEKYFVFAIFNLYLVTLWIWDYYILKINKTIVKLNINVHFLSASNIFSWESQMFLYCNNRPSIRFIISIILLNQTNRHHLLLTIHHIKYQNFLSVQLHLSNFFLSFFLQPQEMSEFCLYKQMLICYDRIVSVEHVSLTWLVDRPHLIICYLIIIKVILRKPGIK